MVATVLKEGGMTWTTSQRAIFTPDLSLYDRFNAAYRVRSARFLRAHSSARPASAWRHFEMMGMQ